MIFEKLFKKKRFITLHTVVLYSVIIRNISSNRSIYKILLSLHTVANFSLLTYTNYFLACSKGYLC